MFHAGTTHTADGIATSGGRVLCVTALGSTVAQAQRRAYRSVERVQWERAYWRRDIGHRAIGRDSV